MAETSANSGTAYQNASTYLFVPQSYGDASTAGDDINRPGAYFRLGGFSDAENAVRMAASPGILGTAVANVRSVPDANASLTPFYPRQHISDESQADAVTRAAGAETDQLGIMLACSGRLLIRSAEKTYLHSVGDIDIDTQGKLTVYADGEMDITSQDEIAITSGTKKNITISAGADDANLGDVEINAYTATRRVAGKNYEYTTEDSYSYCQANAYSYMLGGTVDVVLGGALSFTLGVKLSVSVSIETQIALSVLMAFSLIKIEYTGANIASNGTEMKLSEFAAKIRGIFVGTSGVAATTAGAQAATTGAQASTTGASSSTAGAQASTASVVATTSGAAVHTSGVTVIP